MEHHIRTLQAALAEAGTFESARRYHVVWLASLLTLYAGSFALLLSGPGPLLRTAGIVLAGIVMMQLGLFAHEVGHGAVTRSLAWRNVLGHLSNSLLVGFSFSYWLTTHFTHHNHPNTEGIDPDLESIGYALYPRSLHNVGFVRRLIAKAQPWSVLFGFLGWSHSIKLDGIRYVARNFSRRTAADAVCIALHLALWIALPMAFLAPVTVLVNYFFVMALTGIYMGGILVVPHVGAGTQTSLEHISFFERQVRFSRNYHSSGLGTILCGGLNLQIEHHLLPHVPCIRLRRARSIILAYCLEHRLPYRQTAYRRAWREVLSYLGGIARLARGREVAGGSAKLPKTTTEPLSVKLM